MLDEVKRFMRRKRMVHPGEPVHVAVSGGVDSMVLLHVLRALGHPCQVIHVDHGLRGDGSAADRAFVEAYCAQHQVPVRSVAVDVRSAQENGSDSTQMVARRLRYEAFHSIHAADPGPIALGHHADDAVETLFIQLLRGTGLFGWSGMPPVTGPFFRPLLAVDREAIQAYAVAHDIPFREDPSNQDPKYMRNRIRTELLPLLEDIRPGSRKGLTRSIAAFRDLRDAAERSFEQEFQRDLPMGEHPVCIPFAALEGSLAGGVQLRLLLRPLGFHPHTIDRIAEAVEQRSTSALFTQGKWVVCVDRHGLILDTAAERLAPICIDPRSDPGFAGPFRWHINAGPSVLPVDPNELVLDADTFQEALEVRPWRAGDRMVISAEGGTRTIGNILTDLKVPANERDRILVLTDGNRILWLVGYRVAAGLNGTAGIRRSLRITYRPRS